MAPVLLSMIEITPEVLSSMLTWYVIFVISLTFHEAAHAFAGWRLGDSTAFHGGQVTLNPLPHIQREPIGTIVVPILTFFMNNGNWMMGWASAPYNVHWAIRNPGRAVLMSMAGPAANLFLTFVALAAIAIGLANGFFAHPDPPTLQYTQIVVGSEPGLAIGAAKLLSIMFSLNLLLFVFNLMPVPPLDGGSLWSLVLKHETYRRFQIAMAQPIYWMLGMILAWNVYPFLFFPLYFLSMGLLSLLG